MPEERNVLGGPLEPCGLDPITGFYRDGHCTCGPVQARHLICVVVTADFLAHQRLLGNDLSTPIHAYGFPGLQPATGGASCSSDGCSPTRRERLRRWCWRRPMRVLEVVGLEVLRGFAVHVTDDLSSLD